MSGVESSCPYCEGKGRILMDVGLRTPLYYETCNMCSGTGKRVVTHVDAGDGITARVHGDKQLSPEAMEAIASVARAAIERMDDDAGA